MRYAWLTTFPLALVMASGTFAYHPPVHLARAAHGRPHTHPHGRHQTYQYEGRYLSGVIAHPGGRLAMWWIAEKGPATSRRGPTAIVLSATLVGPYTSLGALKWTQVRHKDGGVMETVATMTVRTTSWTARSLTTTLMIPRSAKSGYYMLRLRATAASERHELAYVLDIQAR